MWTTRTRIVAWMLVSAVVCAGLACTVGTGPGGGAAVMFTIGGRTFTIELTGLTAFNVLANADPVRQGGRATIFTQTPADTPTSGRLLMDAGDAQFTPLNVQKGQLAEQGVTGTATVDVYIAGAGAANPCDEGVFVGSFELAFDGQTVTIVNASIALPPAALAEVMTGSFSICLSVTATVDVSLTISSLAVEFGPSDGGMDNVNDNEAEEDLFTLSVSVTGQGSVDLSPPGGSYPAGTEVTLTATADPDWLFVMWEGYLDGTDNPAMIVMNADASVTAVMRQPEAVFDDPTDFEEGTLVGLEFDSAAGGLTISAEPTTLPFIWVPNSTEGTISKVDTETGDELGRYRVCPEGIVGDPSRTTVDLWGSCYVANRDTGTLVKVGLYENGGYVDRNGNGTIETSYDANGDGDITGDELLPWGEDECVIWEVVLTTADEGPYAPGTYPGTYPMGHWDPGTRGIAIDPSNNVWVGVYGDYVYYYIDGSTGAILRKVDVSSVNHTAYGAVVDRNGILWSSGQSQNHVLRLDPSDDSFTTVALGHFVYGLGVDHNNHLFVSGWQNSKLSRINVLTGAVDWTVDGVYESRGVAVTDDGDVWVADSSPGTVTRWSNDGVIKATINVGNTPTGVAVDAAGKVWVVNYGDEYIKRIDPATNLIDLEKPLIGTRHYGYSDMTGIVARTVSTQIGNWTVDYGAGLDDSLWETVAWGGQEPEGTVISVRVRSSNDQVTWSDWVTVTNGMDLANLPPGNYIQVEVTLQILSGDLSPILSYLAVFAEG